MKTQKDASQKIISQKDTSQENIHTEEINDGKRKGEKKHHPVRTILIILGAVIVFCGVAAIIGKSTSKAARGREYKYTKETRLITDTEQQGVGSAEVSTLKLDKEIVVQRASYSFSGRVLIIWSDGAETVISSLNDDGTDMLELYRGAAAGTQRLLPFADNTRILMGDSILECPEGYTLDDCPAGKAVLVPVKYPDEFSKAENVMDKWTEVIIAPDNKHIAWTILRLDCGAVNAMGRLVRTEAGYEIEDAEYISNMNAFTPDPDREGMYLHNPEIGGEVKQFVHGGRAISLVGSDSGGMADSVVQDIATGKVTRITRNYGYDETTIFSPDEKMGIVMTTRFSETTDMAVLGLVPRPYGEVLHNILGQVYMYGVTGVRSSREGNIGPALINIEASQTMEGYQGLNLSDPEGIWAYHSPMSWKNDSTKAMWMEREKGGNGIRVQIVTLLDYIPDEAVEAISTPAVGSYAQAPSALSNYNVTVAGKVSGSVTIKKETGALGKATVSIVYDNYSDDGNVYISGAEGSSGSATSRSLYKGNLKMTDAEGTLLGGMDVTLDMSAAYSAESLLGGNKSPVLNLETSSGIAVWNGERADISTLVP